MRSRWWIWTLGVIPLYAVMAAVVLWPLCNFQFLDTAVYPGDASLNVWALAWNNHAVLDGVPSYFDANIFHPARQTLALSEHLFGIGLFTLPIYALTRNPVLAYNAAWLFSFLASALAAHWLAWRYTRDHLSALLAGSLYAFCSFRMLHAAGHLHILWSFWVPFTILALAWWFDRPRWLTAIGIGAAIVLQTLSSWYVGVLLIVAAGLFVAWRAVPMLAAGGRRAGAPPAPVTRGFQIGVVGLIAAAAIWPFAQPYFARGLESSRAEVRTYSAAVPDYLLPPLHTWVGQRFGALGARGLHTQHGERAVAVGYAALGSAIVGVVALARARRRPEGGPDGAGVVAREGFYYVALAGVAVACSLGPGSAAEGASDWTPFGLFARLPGMTVFRAPARFALLVTLSVSVLAALGAASWQARWSGRGRALTVLLLAFGLSEAMIVRSGSGRPQPAPVPQVYRDLAAVPARAIVSLPAHRDGTFWWRRADYQYYSTTHWHPIVNGYSRIDPPDHAWIIGHMMAFPGPNSARTMRKLGVDYVVLHADRYPDGGAAVLGEARTARDFALVRWDGAVYLFRVRTE